MTLLPRVSYYNQSFGRLLSELEQAAAQRGSASGYRPAGPRAAQVCMRGQVHAKSLRVVRGCGGDTLNAVLCAFSALLLGMLLFAGVSEAEDYVVGEGDLLQVTVLTHPDLTTAARVSREGQIRLPLIGQVFVAGIALPRIADVIAGRLANGYLVDPQVTVSVQEYRTLRATIIGMVNRTGVYEFRDRLTFLELLSRAGGLSPDADSAAVVTSRSGESRAVDLRGLLTLGNISLDIEIRDGDRVFIAPAPKITIAGEVRRPGDYRHEPGMTAIRALNLAGGLTPDADSRAVITSRSGESRTVDLQALPAAGKHGARRRDSRRGQHVHRQRRQVLHHRRGSPPRRIPFRGGNDDDAGHHPRRRLLRTRRDRPAQGDPHGERSGADHRGRGRRAPSPCGAATSSSSAPSAPRSATSPARSRTPARSAATATPTCSRRWRSPAGSRTPPRRTRSASCAGSTGRNRCTKRSASRSRSSPTTSSSSPRASFERARRSRDPSCTCATTCACSTGAGGRRWPSSWSPSRWPSSGPTSCRRSTARRRASSSRRPRPRTSGMNNRHVQLLGPRLSTAPRCRSSAARRPPSAPRRTLAADEGFRARLRGRDPAAARRAAIPLPWRRS